MGVPIYFSPSAWQAPPAARHSFLDEIREAASTYRLQSAAHFDVPIDVCQATHPSNPDRFANVDRDFQLRVGFYHFGTDPVFAVCRPTIAKRGCNKEEVIKGAVQVWMENQFVPVMRFLEATFPTYNQPVAGEVMFQWWKANGKTFNWIGLPTEVKERIVQCCMHHSPPLPVQHKSRGRVRHVEQGAPEVLGQLGKWASLLTVSHQVRAISLRLCFAGSSDLAFNGGLCIVAESYASLQRTLRRLEKHRQLVKANSVPTDDHTRQLEKAYLLFPRMYPQLDRYATFKQGIRKMHLQFSFLDSLFFFQVTAGSFAQHWKPHWLTYKVLETLPHLKALRLTLPDAHGRLEDDLRKQPVSLFYGEPFNCPRTLHRLIYERVAQVLAAYEAVTLHGFMDEEEQVRFGALRELYKKDVGGVQLDETAVGRKQRPQDIVYDDFWPPKCRCKTLCRQVLHPSSI